MPSINHSFDKTMSFWSSVRHLFEQDDGSLPDIFVEALSPDQVIAAYEWLRTRGKPQDDATVWSNEKQADVLIRDVPFPARALCDGRIDGFRHQLIGLSINGVKLPPLTVLVSPNELSFDYRMGAEWDERKLLALFELLRTIRSFAPEARILQAEEGSYDNPSSEFSKAFELYAASAGA